MKASCRSGCICDLLRAMAISRSAFSWMSALRRLSFSSRTLSAAAQAIWASSLSLGDVSQVLPLEEVEDQDLFLSVLDATGVGLFVWLTSDDENSLSQPTNEGSLEEKGSLRPFQLLLLEKALSKGILLFGEENGSSSPLKGSKVLLSPVAVATATVTTSVLVKPVKGSSRLAANGSLKPTSLKGSTVNSNSA